MIHFHGVNIGENRADLIVESRVVVECKVATKILPLHEAQLLNYFKAMQRDWQLLIRGRWREIPW